MSTLSWLHSVQFPSGDGRAGVGGFSGELHILSQITKALHPTKTLPDNYIGPK